MNATENQSRPMFLKSRPSVEYIERLEVLNLRDSIRLEASRSAEVVTNDGKAIKATLRDISVTGLGFVHTDQISPGEVFVTVFRREQNVHYRMDIVWSRECGNGLFMSGGRFIKGSDTPCDSNS